MVSDNTPKMGIYLCLQRSRGRPGGVLDFGFQRGCATRTRDPNPCLEVKKVPMFRDFAQKNGPMFRDFLKIFWARVASPENFCDFDEK